MLLFALALVSMDITDNNVGSYGCGLARHIFSTVRFTPGHDLSSSHTTLQALERSDESKSRRRGVQNQNLQITIFKNL